MEREEYCENCKKTHVIVAEVTEAELGSLKFMNNRISVAESYLANEEASSAVKKAAMEVIADSSGLRTAWWEAMAQKYNFSLAGGEVFVNFDKLQLFYNKE